MGRYTGKTCRLLSMLSLTLSFFLVEIVVGYITNSLALVGDSYHMLSDVVALCVGFASVRISKWHSQKNTFGWARAEVLGALVNAVFLMALCFTIFVEALQRLSKEEEIENPDLLLIVGGLGLLINIIGLFLFHGDSHGHSHGGGSSHTHSHNHPEEERRSLKAPDSADSTSGSPTTGNDVSHKHSHKHSPSRTFTSQESEDEFSEEEEGHNISVSHKLSTSSQLNMRGVFLHVLGDALGSIIVIISALVIKYVDAKWRFKVDPAMSMIMVIIIFSTTLPLLKESALILLQTVPTHIVVPDLKAKLIEKVEGVLAVHEFHIWQLTGNRIIASAHIRCQNLSHYMRLAEEVKVFFHNEGIHSTTIQPEFVEFEEIKEGRDCVLECGPDKQCFPDTCCGTKKVTPGMVPEVTAGGEDCQLRQRGPGCGSVVSVSQVVAVAATPEPSSTSL